MITLLHEIVELRFKDFRRALYVSKNYRLRKNLKKRLLFPKDAWGKLNEEERSAKFAAFLKNQYKRKSTIVKSTYSKRQLHCNKTIHSEKAGTEKKSESC